MPTKPTITGNHNCFIGLDGEGYDRDGTHIYNLLGSSTGDYIHDDDGLRTIECFQFLLDQKTKVPDGIFVSFYFSYDVNMMLRYLGTSAVDWLKRKGFCYVYDRDTKGLCWKIEYIPKKIFSLSKGQRITVGDKRKFRTIQKITVYDVWGFFQSSFVRALREFEVTDCETLDLIQSMKGQRSEFTTDDIESIVHYNSLECSLLADLMDIVRDRFTSVGINLTSWHGAGASASAVLKKHSIKKHLEDNPSEPFQDAVMSAYFGGRIQSLQIGTIESLHAYDIVSAYPSIMVDLPSLKGFTVRETDRLEPGKLAVYNVTWSIPTCNKVTPFPFRMPDGTIEYPYNGSGSYWSYEVETAVRHYPGCITIENGFILETIDPHSRPFEFIREYFDWRKQLKRNNDKAQICLKLALNSLYGKTAQSVGFNGSKPPYQSYIYAGLITSGTRARMLDLAMSDQSAIVCFATDGLVTTNPVPCTLGESLGDWEYTPYQTGLFIKPGFYRLKGTKETIKVRGFPAPSIDFDKLESVWNTDGINGTVTIPVRQFIGMKSASENRPWLSWQDSVKSLSFWPSKGDPLLLSDNPPRYYLEPLYVADGRSARYKKGTVEPDLVDLPDLEFMVGID